jgi:hypothetical protein
VVRSGVSSQFGAQNFGQQLFRFAERRSRVNRRIKLDVCSAANPGTPAKAENSLSSDRMTRNEKPARVRRRLSGCDCGGKLSSEGQAVNVRKKPPSFLDGRAGALALSVCLMHLGVFAGLRLAGRLVVVSRVPAAARFAVHFAGCDR